MLRTLKTPRIRRLDLQVALIRPRSVWKLASHLAVIRAAGLICRLVSATHQRFGGLRKTIVSSRRERDHPLEFMMWEYTRTTLRRGGRAVLLNHTLNIRVSLSDSMQTEDLFRPTAPHLAT